MRHYSVNEAAASIIERQVFSNAEQCIPRFFLWPSFLRLSVIC